jgi:hypothetical protein
MRYGTREISCCAALCGKGIVSYRIESVKLASKILPSNSSPFLFVLIPREMTISSASSVFPYSCSFSMPIPMRTAYISHHSSHFSERASHQATAVAAAADNTPADTHGQPSVSSPQTQLSPPRLTQMPSSATQTRFVSSSPSSHPLSPSSCRSSHSRLLHSMLLS